MSHEPVAHEPLVGLDAVLVQAGSGTSSPGAQAALMREGELVWSGTFGVAEIGGDRPVTRDTVFCLASLGKTLVAALALRLVEQNVLDLDAPIGRVVTEVPGADVVTPRMLLTHTSGYSDVYETPELAPLFPAEGEIEGGTSYDPERRFTWEMLLPGFRDPVKPGERWEYSNGGYILLTELMVRLLGGPEALAEAWNSLAGRVGDGRITENLLTLDRSCPGPDRLAHGYVVNPDGALVDAYAAHSPSGVPTDLFGLPFGDGLFAGTAVGVATFLDGLFVRRTVLDVVTLELMTTTTAQAAAAVRDVPDPALATYGMGTFRTEAAGGTWQGHRGTYGGFNVLGMSDVGRGVTFAVLTNVMGEEPAAMPIWRALAEALGAQSVTTGAGEG
ncbi:MAG: beta-lactamase family protein [Nocardioides sp.]|nr:beta-lactamase family protein [Nocardioides sp.]